MTNKKLIIGFLIMTLLASGVVYIQLSEDVKLRVDDDKTTFYVPHSEYGWIWQVSGREYNRLFDGSSIMYRDAKNVVVETLYDNGSKEVWITRTTPYIRGPVVVDTYYFDGDINDVELFPISHKVEVFNGSGLFYRYTVDELEDTGPKRKLVDEYELSFGLNMNVELEEGYRWAWIGWPYGSDSVSAQYDVESDYEVFEVRLFDPVFRDDDYYGLVDSDGTPTDLWHWTKYVSCIDGGNYYTLAVNSTGDQKVMLYNTSDINSVNFSVLHRFPNHEDNKDIIRMGLDCGGGLVYVNYFTEDFFGSKYVNYYIYNPSTDTIVWEYNSTNSEPSVSSLIVDVNGRVWMSNNTYLYYSDDNGSSWTKDTSTSGYSSYNIHKIEGSDKLFGYYSSSSDIINIYYNGSSWRSVDSPHSVSAGSYSMYSRPANDGENIYLASLNDTSTAGVGDWHIYKFNESNNWTEISTIPANDSSEDCTLVNLNGTDNFYFVGINGSNDDLVLYTSSDGANSWTFDRLINDSLTSISYPKFPDMIYSVDDLFLTAGSGSNVYVYTFKTNNAPAVSLNSPADNSTGVGVDTGSDVNVTLNVTVTDDDGDDMNVSFYVNVGGEDWWSFMYNQSYYGFGNTGPDNITSNVRTNAVSGGVGDVGRGGVVVGDYAYFGLNNDKGVIKYDYTNNTIVSYFKEDATGDINGAPVYDGTYLYAGDSDGYLYKINISDMSHVANYSTGGVIVSTPVYDDDYVYFGIKDDYLFKINKTDMSYVANYSCDVEVGPVISGDFIYVKCGAETINGQIDRLYKSDLSLNTSYLFANTYMPIIIGDYMYYGDISYVIKMELANSSSYTTYSDCGNVFAPLSWDGDYLYFGDGNGDVFKLNITDMSHVANYSTGGAIDEGIAVTSKYLYFGSDDNYFYQLNKTDMSLVSRYESPNSADFASMPMVANGYVITGDQGSDLFIFGDGYLLRGTNTGVSNGSSTSFTQTGLSYETEYDWYVTSTDGTNTTNSSVWKFTTMVSDTVPDAPTVNYPEDNGTVSSTSSVNLNVSINDNDGDSMNVTFYNATDGVICELNNQTNGDVNCTWTSLNSGETYDWGVNVTDDDGNEVSGGVWNFTINTVPSYVLNAPSDGETGLGNDVVLNITVTDSDNDLLNVTFFNKTGGTTELHSENSVSNGEDVNYTWSSLSSGSTYEWCVNVSDAYDSNTSCGDTWEFTISGLAASSLDITPDPAYFNTSLTCSYDFTNSTGGSGSDYSYYKWHINGVENETGRNGGTSSVTLSSDNFDQYDNVTCEIIPNDNQGVNGTSVNVTQTINNYAPDSPSLNSPTDGVTNTALSKVLNITITDPEGDSMDVEFFNNATGVSIGTVSGVSNGSSVNHSWSGLSRCTVYYWYANVTDGNKTTKSGVWGFTTSCLNTTIPVISPIPAYFNTSLTCSYTFTNGTNGTNSSDYSYYKWYVNGVVNETGQNSGVSDVTLDNSNFDHFDNVTCEITPHDGSAPINGTSRNSTVLEISNYAPVCSDFGLNKSLLTSTPSFDFDITTVKYKMVDYVFTYDINASTHVDNMTTNLSSHCTDPEGDSISYSVTDENTSQADCSIDSDNLTVDPYNDWFGVAECNVTADDGYNTSIVGGDFNITNGSVSIEYVDNTTLFDINISSGLINDTPNSSDIGVHVIEITIRNSVNNEYNVSDTFNYSVGDIQLLLHGLNLNRKYELGTSANVTGKAVNLPTNLTICLDFIDDFDYGDNYTCDNDSEVYVNYTKTEVEQDRFNDSTTSKNFTMNETRRFYLNLDGNITITESEFDILGYNNTNHTSDLKIDVFGDGTIDAYLPGELRGKNLYINSFDDGETSKNVSFKRSGTNTVYVNISMNNYFNNETGESGIHYILDNITMTLNGFDIDPDHLDFWEYFENSSYLQNNTCQAPFFIYDDFSQGEVSGRWDSDSWASSDSDYGDTNWDTDLGFVTGNYLYSDSLTLDASTGCTCNCYLDSCDECWRQNGATVYDDEIELLDYSNVYVDIYFYVRGRGSAINTMGCGRGSALTSIGLYDLTTDSKVKTILTEDASASSCWGGSQDVVNTDTSTVRIKRDEDDELFYLYDDGVLYDTYNYDPSHSYTYYLSGTNSVSISGSSAGGRARAIMRVTNVNVSGAKGAGNMTYFDDCYFSSTRLINASQNISRGLLDVDYEKPSGTDLSFYLSNDNGSTWESVVDNSIHSFSSSGNELKYKIVLNSSATNDSSPTIKGVNALIIPGFVEDIEIDVGNDGTTEWNYTGKLNSTNSPQNVSLSPEGYVEFLTNNYINNLSGLLPITFKVNNPGVIEISDVNVTQNISVIWLNETLISSFTTNKTGPVLNFSLQSSDGGGIVNINNLVFQYKDDKTYSIRARFEGSGEFAAKNDTKNLSWRYSPITVNFPTGVSSYDVYATTVNDKNIEPFGQVTGDSSADSTPIFTITTDAEIDNVDIYEYYTPAIDSCLSLYSCNSYDKSDCILTNTSKQLLINNMSRNGEGYVYHYWNLSSCDPTNLYLPFNYYHAPYCEGCVFTGD